MVSGLGFFEAENAYTENLPEIRSAESLCSLASFIVLHPYGKHLIIV